MTSFRLALAASITLALAGCGSTPPEVDTAETIKSETAKPAPPAPAPTAPTEPAKDAPKG